MLGRRGASRPRCPSTRPPSAEAPPTFTGAGRSTACRRRGASTAWCDAARRKRDEMKVFPGGQREAFGLADGDIEQELLLVPRLVETPVDVERAPGDIAEEEVDVTDDELTQGVTHGCAAGAAAAGLHEHHRAAPGGAQGSDRLVRRRGGSDACRNDRLGHHRPQKKPSGLVL